MLTRSVPNYVPVLRKTFFFIKMFRKCVKTMDKSVRVEKKYALLNYTLQ